MGTTTSTTIDNGPEHKFERKPAREVQPEDKVEIETGNKAELYPRGKLQSEVQKGHEDGNETDYEADATSSLSGQHSREHNFQTEKLSFPREEHAELQSHIQSTANNPFMNFVFAKLLQPKLPAKRFTHSGHHKAAQQVLNSYVPQHTLVRDGRKVPEIPNRTPIIMILRPNQSCRSTAMDI